MIGMEWFLGILLLHLVLASVAFFLISLDKWTEKQRKGSQIVVTFFVPVIGPILVVGGQMFLRSKNDSKEASPIGQSYKEHRNKFGEN